VAEAVLSLAWTVLDDNTADLALCRAAAELAAAAASVGSDSLSARLVRGLCRDVRDSADSGAAGAERRRDLLLDVGSCGVSLLVALCRSLLTRC
jgi:hypothetical protein